MNYTPDELRELGVAFGDDVTIHRSVAIFGGEYLRIGSHVRIDAFCVLTASGGGVTIGNRIHLSTHAVVLGGGAAVTLEDFCCLSVHTALFTSADSFSGTVLAGPMVPTEMRIVKNAPVIVGRHVLIGAGTVILPGVTLGLGSAVGAMSLVREDVEPFALMAGNPLRRIGTRDQRILELERQLGS